ncbi:class A beta-lactamase-related serine hydrolase [Pseudoalteromonas tunicata]|nr:class A beta-lactamase-related serine hydrolase [Pseudoalteromonas tunicata]
MFQTSTPELKHLTIERVLSHSAGLPDYVNDEAVNNLCHRYAILDEFIKTISTGSPPFAMGREYRYSNSGYLYLGKIIEVVSGKSYHDYLRDSFFIPLNMNNTFVIEKGVTAGNVTAYTRRESAPDTYLEPALEQKWLVDRSWISAAGAIASTLTDISRWQIALHSGKVISNHNYHLMTTQTKLNNGEFIHYGLGLNVYPISNKLTYKHDGMVPGFFHGWCIFMMMI